MTEIRRGPSGAERLANLNDINALQDLIAALWLYVGRHAETQLTTEQKELFADVVEIASPDDGLRVDRWWRR